MEGEHAPEDPGNRIGDDERAQDEGGVERGILSSACVLASVECSLDGQWRIHGRSEDGDGRNGGSLDEEMRGATIEERLLSGELAERKGRLG